MKPYWKIALPAIVAAVVAGSSLHAHATAIFTGDAGFTVSLPGAIPNVFGYAPVSDGDDGMAITPGSAGVTETVSGLSISGQADPDGTAMATAQAGIQFNLENLTGSGDASPPAQTVTVPVTGSFTYNLGATTGGCVFCLETASALFRFEATLGDTVLTQFVDGVTAGLVDATNVFNFLLTLPAHSVTAFVLTATLEGEALSRTIADVPGPTPLLVALIGIAGLAWFGNRNRRRSGTAHHA